MKKKICIIASVFLFTFGFSSNAFSQWIQTTLVKQRMGAFATIKDDIFASGDSGIFRTSDDGKAWTSLNLARSNPYSPTLAVIDTNLYAGVWLGLAHSSDRGRTWDFVANNKGISTLCVSDTNLYIGTYGELYKISKNDTNLNTVLFDEFVVASAANGSIIVIRAEKLGVPVGYFEVLTSTNYGRSWNSALIGKYVNAFAFHDNFIFAGLSFEGIYRSQDSGKNWKAIAFDKTNVYAFTTRGENIFAGTDSGIFISKDNGNIWISMNSGLIDKRVIALTSTNSFLFAATEKNGVWRRPLSDFGIAEVKKSPQPDLNLSLSPNPTTGIITVHNAPANILRVSVTSILGESAIEFANPIAPEFTLDLSKLPPGIYFATFATSSGIVTKKIIKE